MKSPKKRVALVRLAVSSEPHATPGSRNCSNEGSAEVSFDHMTLTDQLLEKLSMSLLLLPLPMPHTLPQILLCNSAHPPVAVEVSRSVDLAAIQKKEKNCGHFQRECFLKTRRLSQIVPLYSVFYMCACVCVCGNKMQRHCYFNCHCAQTPATYKSMWHYVTANLRSEPSLRIGADHLFTSLPETNGG